MAAVPDATPVTNPEEFIIAIVVLALLHVPAPASVKTVVSPWQTVAGPEIAAGTGFTVTAAAALQPVGKV